MHVSPNNGVQNALLEAKCLEGRGAGGGGLPRIASCEGRKEGRKQAPRRRADLHPRPLGAGRAPLWQGRGAAAVVQRRVGLLAGWLACHGGGLVARTHARTAPVPGA